MVEPKPVYPVRILMFAQERIGVYLAKKNVKSPVQLVTFALISGAGKQDHVYVRADH